ncbi:MAG: hypothetical protein OES24_13135 [Acidimicrobiia bacterium]|nr:hypothetical protein [Acidimicrobiia bacterium]
MVRFVRRWFGLDRRLSRAELIDRKHRLQGEIDQLNRRIRAGTRRGENVAPLQARVEQLRDEHHQTRLRIDRTP